MSAGETVYVLTIMSFIDDYKTRGNDWATLEVTKVFSSRENATAYVDSWLRVWLEMKYEDYDLGDPDNTDERKQYFTKAGKLKQNVCPRGVHYEFTDGEYVPTKLQYNITELVIDADVPVKRRKIKR